MRLWSIHPSYLDARGLVALWREGLLAQAVLQGKTVGYKNHPQLVRFKNSSNPLGAIAAFLRHVANEADRRGYNFDRCKIIQRDFHGQIPVTNGQITYEFKHLLGKLKNRNPERYAQLRTVKAIEPHPLLQARPGQVEAWEIRENPP